MNQDFVSDLNKLMQLINDKKPFAFMKFADGEMSLIKNIAVHTETQAFQVDKWSAPNSPTKLGKDLSEAIAIQDPNVYIGISCDCCDSKGKEILWDLINNPKENVTYSNIFINGNYPLALDFLKNIQEPINLISNYITNINNFPIKVNKFLPIPNNCVHFYEYYKDYFLKTLDIFKNVSNELFLVSAGPLSEVIIYYLWKINPTNRYVDVGSAIGEWVHGHAIRDFSHINSQFRYRMCHMSLKNKSEKCEN